MKLKIPHVENVENKRVLVRVDYNVPLKKNSTGKLVVADDRKIKASLETIQYLLNHKAKIILMSHLGWPGGKRQNKFSLKPIQKHLAKLLDQEILFSQSCVGQDTQKLANNLEVGQILLLENTRFHPGEEKNNLSFAQQLGKLADTYINEAFSVSHRKHVSLVEITKVLPGFAGINLSKEVKNLHELMTKPKRPLVMVVGGKKISDKVEAVVNLAKIADIVLLGGGTANNFLKADGFEIYKSFVEDTPPDKKKRGINYVKVAEHLIKNTKQDRMLKDGYIPLPKIMYPIDVISASSPDSATSETIELVNNNHEKAMKKNLMYLDIGPKTIKLYRELILQAGTVFWNGPMGVFEKTQFATGTRAIAKAIAKSGATTVLGGGDTIAAINKFNLSDRYDYVSAAGGAALEFLAGKTLPGLKPLLMTNSKQPSP
ncbi:MAG: phosphoglycerate kinase [Patescibacteria group bacterium]